jgi:hypothetical protein
VMDIVKRLRQEIAGYTDGPIEAAEATMREAADEIERMRKALRMWVRFWEEDDNDVWLAEKAMEETRKVLGNYNVYEEK